ncbi:hypothetical protein [Marivita hallyeonensis]|uniref:Uncharacterized protein n=1 Tax=Marivita hallyeonensis TaxID=996342 RepID=A0A1M5NGT6_9RHOB|nr:hypothetical protein [Marivita hallyeonensis]SHG88645.1 hypothetical protein SAMN05443551_0919 [Marivita hallyeonensis]
MTRQTIDAIFLFLGGALLFAAFVVSALSRDAFFIYFGAEDSLVENATAVGLACAGAVLLARVWRVRGAITRLALVLGTLYGLAYIWVAGEEVSWGQRILGFESPEYFQENNDQQEFTFHNLVIGGVKLDELIFGPALSYIILSYLIILPVLWPRAAWVRRVTERLVIPVPHQHHALFALIVTVIIPFLGESRRWEVYECIFALLSLGIFLNPANPLSTTGATSTGGVDNS